MITKMKKYTFLVFHQDYNRFLERLREAGVVHIAEKGDANPADEEIQQQMTLLQQLRTAIGEAKALLPKQPVMGSSDEKRALGAAELMRELADLKADMQQLRQTVLTTEKEMQRVAVWGGFSNEKMEQLAAEGWVIQCYFCPKSAYEEEWETLYHTFKVAEEKGVVYFVSVSRSNEAFEIPAEKLTLGSRNSAQLAEDIAELKNQLAAKQAQAAEWAAKNLPALCDAEKETLRSINWQKANNNTSSLADNTIRLLEGFCPVDNAEALDKQLEADHVYYQVSEPAEEDDTPIKLRNNRFTRMFECLTGMYGWPVYGEADPTPILAPFFLLFFALCMGDAGYGIILILFGILTTRNILKIGMFEGLGPLITTLGVGTMVVGFFLGTFFGIDLYTASWVPDVLKKVMIKGEVMGYDIQMVMALGIGVFHICLAMVVKAVIYTRRFGWKANISTWGWLVLILGGLLTAVLALTEVFSAEVTKWVLIVIGAVSALAIYIFNTPGRNPLINVGAGLWDTYNMATGLLGDVLSYIRLYALGLAGGMLGGAFNTLGIMVLGEHPNVGTWAGFIVILLIGHLLNLCMSALGAFVHPLRLSFVEYFKNSGYEGKGHLYEPFREEMN